MQTLLGLHFVPFPGLRSSGDEVLIASTLLGFLGVQPAHLLRQMLTMQNPKKSYLAKKPAYSFVDNVSLGLRLPPSGSVCLSPEVGGLQLAISVQFFVLREGLVAS